MNHTRHPFTLIELLVVVVLISMLVGITVPVYTRVMTGNAVVHGSSLIASQLNMARVEACRSRRKVAVVFMNEQWTAAETVPDDKEGIFNRRAFRSCYVDAANKFEEWIPGGKWQLLPKGAFLAAAAKGGHTPEYSGTVTDVDNEYDDANPPEGVAKLFDKNRSFTNAVIFDATGRPEGSPKVVIAEGTINSNTPDTKTDALKDNADNGNVYKPNADNWAMCAVNGYTGKVRTQLNE